ncbi:MAG: phage tail sheath subtilisin-like domain-containing protein [Crocinitomicaceae bacterium]|nr:phage tail sheath subtilisin-like domain-containing protein [Crocinitomicaceae bacterium]
MPEIFKTNNTTASSYRGTISPTNHNDLSYGAAYYPHLETSLGYSIDEVVSTYGTDILDNITMNSNYGVALEILNANNKVTIPPSSLMAGVYAKTDRDSGFWKAPANAALQGVIKPVDSISDNGQMNLNVDANSGKSINVIRTFTGKGTLVWGARTLAGNSLDWKYIPVRRSFITIEESVKKAISQFVFETNDSKTWNKVSAMIRAYLNGLWKDGALMGANAKEAYFVQVGLGTSMTQQDILDGKMKVKIGLAAVRPAEFIVLEFSHFISQ